MSRTPPEGEEETTDLDDDDDQSIVTLRMTGTRKLGCVFRQNDRIETQMKNTDTKPTIYYYYRKIVHIFIFGK